MFICDTSVVDWDAVGAVGTWVIGIAAIWAAFQANAIPVRLKHAQEERDKQAARAMLVGLRVEALHYAKRLKRFVDTLQKIVGESDDSIQLVNLVRAYRMIQNAALIDIGHRVAALASVPQHLAEDIHHLYARERTNRTVFQNSAELVEGATHVANPMPQLRPILIASAKEIGKSAEQVLDTVKEISVYLGLPLEEDL